MHANEIIAPFSGCMVQFLNYIQKNEQDVTIREDSLQCKV